MSKLNENNEERALVNEKGEEKSGGGREREE